MKVHGDSLGRAFIKQREVTEAEKIIYYRKKSIS